MSKETKKAFDAIKDSIVQHKDFGKEEVTAIACTAALIAALDRNTKILDEKLEELIISIYKNA